MQSTDKRLPMIMRTTHQPGHCSRLWTGSRLGVRSAPRDKTLGHACFAGSLARGLAWFWNGEWQMLWGPAHIPRRVRPSFARAHAISATTSGSDGSHGCTEGQVSQAVSARRALLGLETNARELDAISSLFPQCDGDVMAPAKSPIDPAWAERVHRSALRILWDLPTGVEPRLDASRF